MPVTTERTRVPCQVVSNHPSSGGKPISWTAEAEKVDRDILLIHDAIPRIQELPALAEEHADRFVSAMTVTSDLKEVYDNNQRRCKRLSLTDNDAPPELVFFGLLLRTMESQFLTHYFHRVNHKAQVVISSGYDLLKYEQGGFFREHVDTVHDHPVLAHRRLSLVFFCNDDYEGGRLVFPRQEVAIEPKAGLAVYFPSGITHPHEVTPVLKGTRYSIVSWFF